MPVKLYGTDCIRLKLNYLSKGLNVLDIFFERDQGPSDHSPDDGIVQRTTYKSRTNKANKNRKVSKCGIRLLGLPFLPIFPTLPKAIMPKTAPHLNKVFR